MAAQADGRVLVLGALAGVAGLSLAAVWYQSQQRSDGGRRRSACPTCPSGENDERRRAAAAGTMMRGSSSSNGIGGAGGGGGGGQAEVLARLEALIQCVSELKDEMKALKSALPTLQDHVRDELRGGRGGLAEGAAAGGAVATVGPLHRSTPTRRKRAARRALSTGGGGGARAEGRSSEEAESEGGYITALTDSEGDESNDEGRSGEEEEEEEEPADDLKILLDRIDALHDGTPSDKRESLDTLQENRDQFGQSSPFLWRLVRAYCDAHDVSSSLEEKKAHAETGKQVGEEAVNLNPLCAESHQWYAIMCGIMAEYDTVQNKIKNGYIFKDHLDKAIELKPHDPLSYYLLGRWCYAVAQLSWIERKVAATLFGEPPTASVQDALKHFLKAEEIRPRYSKANYVFLAKCYRDLNQKREARQMCDAASSMDTVSKEDEEAQKELDILCPSLGV